MSLNVAREMWHARRMAANELVRREWARLFFEKENAPRKRSTAPDEWREEMAELTHEANAAAYREY